MTTQTPSEPSESSAIVGDDLEHALHDAGVKPPQARALRAAVELIVLRLMAVMATKADLADLRQEFKAEQRETRHELKDEMQMMRADNRRAIDELRRELRWSIFLVITILGGMMVALLTRTF